MNRRENPYAMHGTRGKAWSEGHEAAHHNLTVDAVWTQEKKEREQCDHHPEAMTVAAFEAAFDTIRVTAHQGGVAAGRRLEQDKIGQELILMAQEYGHAQFVFTADNMEDLNNRVTELGSTLDAIQDLR